MLDLMLQLCNNPCSTNFHAECSNICLLQVRAICIQDSHDNIVGQGTIHCVTGTYFTIFMCLLLCSCALWTYSQAFILVFLDKQRDF